MLVLKCVGAGAVVAGAFLLGRAYRKELGEKESLAARLEQGLLYLEGRIALSERMLCDVMSECSEKFFGGLCGNVFGEFARRLSSGGELGASWRESVGEMRLEGGEIPLKEQEILMGLEEAFSLGDVERYSESFKNAAEEMKVIRVAAEAKRQKEGNTAVKLGLCGALAAVLVMW